MFNSKLSSEFVKFENFEKKKAATLIVMHYTAFSVYELCLAPKMDCMAFEKVVTYVLLFYERTALDSLET
jgi:hypothetical protein